MLLNICRTTRFARVLSLVMALHIFNLSVDSRDPNPDTVPEDLSFNDIESITEFFAEVVFDFKNAFEEHDEADSIDGGTLDFYKFYCSNAATLLQQQTPAIVDTAEFVVTNADCVPSLSLEVISPPPKSIA